MIIDEENFILGMDRVGSIILGNPNYGDILGKRIIDINFIDEKDKTKSIESAIEYISSNFKKRGVRIYEDIKYSDCLVFVKTKNNLREFELFKRIVEIKNTNFSYTNLAETKLVNAKLPKQEVYSLINQLGNIFRRYYSSKVLNACVLYQHYQYLCAYIDFMYTLSYDKEFKMHFTANDHSPIPVALTMLCIKYGIYTIYFQHGSVSKYFPELIFDLSILYNQKSLDLYSINKSNVVTKNFVLARSVIDSLQNILLRLQNIQRKLKNIVVIYLTAIFEQKNLLDLVTFLKNDSYIEDIYIKFHPSISSEYKSFILGILDIKSCEKIPSFDHIAIVGNSSVLLELISEGIPSLNCFELDSVEKDYYGFVNSGISTQIEIGEFIQDSVRLLSYDNDFVNTVTHFNPSFNDCYRSIHECIREEISIYIGMILTDEPKKYKTLFLENQMAKLFFCYTEKLREITNIELMQLGFSIEDMVVFLENKFKDRDERLINTLNSVLLGETSNLLYVWLQMYKIEWTGFKPEPHHLDEFSLNILNIEKGISKKVYKILENKLLNILIRYKYIKGIENYFAESNYVNIGNLHINRRIALLKVINDKNSNIEPDLLYDGISPYHLLKMEVQGIHKDRALKINHRSLENKILSLSNQSLAAEFDNYVIPVYEFFRKKMKFMDVSHNKEEVEYLKELIVSKIKSSTPFCFMRLSDGEGYIFSKLQTFMSLADIRNRERHWWGCELNSDMREEITDNLVTSLHNVDLIGIPTVYRFIRDSVDKTESFLGYLQGRGMYNVLQGLYSSPSTCNPNFIGSDKVNLSLLACKEDFIELMKPARHIVFITSVKKSLLASKFDSSFNIDYIELPTHFKTSGNDLYNNNSEPLPFVYKDIIHDIDKTIQKGSLVFVAGGIIGKIFISRCKQSGGIVIDVGSAIDMLVDAGIHSLH